MPDELIHLSAAEASRGIREGVLSAQTYAAALVQRQQALVRLGALISFDPDLVLQQARRIDEERRAGRSLGPLAGVPFVVKDQIETAWYPTTGGTPALRGYQPGRNAPVVQRLLGAGAVLFATANMHELASGGTSNNPAFGAVRNPYALDRSPGGSSGGTAAAIAARIVPIGLGEDTGGSSASRRASAASQASGPPAGPASSTPTRAWFPLRRRTTPRPSDRWPAPCPTSP